MKLFILLLSISLCISCEENKAKKTDTNKAKVSETVTTKISQDTSNVIFQKLQGTWVNVDAPLSALTFQGDKVINTYDGFDTKKNITFILGDNCGTKDTENIPKEVDKYILTSGDAAECYYIVKLDETSLVLGFWGVETALRFKKQ